MLCMDIIDPVIERTKSLSPLPRSGTGTKVETKVFSNIADLQALPWRAAFSKPALDEIDVRFAIRKTNENNNAFRGIEGQPRNNGRVLKQFTQIRSG